MGADASGIRTRADRFTPTYCKPLARLPAGGVRELERLDTKNRTPLPADLREELIGEVRGFAGEVQGVIAQDQVEEAECGVIGRDMCAALAELAAQHPTAVWFGDSRIRVGEYRGLIIKPNRQEACQAVHPAEPAHDPEGARRCAAALSRRVGGPVYLTLGAEGMALVTAGRAQSLPTARLAGELDIVGAGDSASAGIVAGLCAGATPEEAGLLGNIAASITVQQIGTTGTATQEQISARFEQYAEVWRDLPSPMDLPPEG